MEQYKIFEHIENLTFRKRVGGVDQEQVFKAIREISSICFTGNWVKSPKNP